MSRLELSFVLAAAVAAVSCDGTLTGIGRVPRPAEAPLPAASAEKGTGPDGGAAPGSLDQPVEIVAQHLLVMYAGSKAAPKNLKRTRDEARARAAEALVKIKGGEEFDKVVTAYTDEPGGPARHGELGRFSRDMMVKPFSDAAFALQVGQVSTVIETQFGFHVIRRME
jgi:NIMA-interacting peptidyl-prolyl cis-trans isomerase 1